MFSNRFKFKTKITESKSDNRVSGFNWIDINDKIIDYKVSGHEMYIDLVINKKQNLMQVKEEGELQNYDEMFKVYCEDVENARRMKYAFKEVIERCRKSYKSEVPEGSKEAKIKWLQTAIKEVRIGTTTFNQSLKMVEDGNTNKFKFTQIEIDEKGSTENIYELNFFDLNERSIDYHISGKSVSIAMETNFKEKIMKYYKDGEIQNYEEELSIQTNGIEECRNIIKALIDITTLSKGK